jgi:hypothetical protein
MQDESSRNAGRNGKDSAPPPVRENTEAEYHQDNQYSDLDRDRSHRLPLPCKAYHLNRDITG